MPLSIHFFVNFLPEDRMISNKFKYATNTSMSLLVLRIQLLINRYGLKHQNVPVLLPFLFVNLSSPASAESLRIFSIKRAMHLI